MVSGTSSDCGLIHALFRFGAVGCDGEQAVNRIAHPAADRYDPKASGEPD